MHELEKILERLGAYICDELCCHRDIGADRGEYAMQEICEKCELSGYLDEIRKCLSCENNTEITRFSRDSDWILVSERLPEEGKEVLAQFDVIVQDMKNGFQKITYIYILFFENGNWNSVFGAPNGEVIAWCPLPKPYCPKAKVPERKQEWKERMLRNFLRGHDYERREDV